MRYEGYGPGDTAVMVECLTEDPERLGSELRRVFAAHGGHLGAEGSVAYLFNPVGVLLYEAGDRAESLERKAFEAGAEDIETYDDGSVEVVTDPVEVETIRTTLVDGGFSALQCEVTQRAWASAEVAGAAARSMLSLLNALEALDGVQNVYSNAEIPDEVLETV